MQGPKSQLHLKMLGRRLRLLREGRHESLAEVSGAVEIEADTLARIESGDECPTEDILLLLINHLGIHEHEAIQLWEWAGYSQDDVDKQTTTVPQNDPTKATLVLLALDARVLYSDDVTVTADRSGLVINFLQHGPIAGQTMPVSRIGMSHEQAQRVLDALQQAILKQRYLPSRRLLPPGDQH